MAFALLTFDFGGGETLSAIDFLTVCYVVIALLILFGSFHFANKYKQKQQLSTALGVILVPLAVFVVVSSYMLFSFRNTPFNQKTWQETRQKPEDMAKTLVRKKILIGLNTREIETILGQGSATYGDKATDRGSIIYDVENTWTLVVLFEYDKVVEVKMSLPYLGV